MPDRFNIGDEVKVMFNIKGTKWMKEGKENYITNLDAWRMETASLGGNGTPSDAPPSFVPDASPAEGVDDLPF